MVDAQNPINNQSVKLQAVGSDDRLWGMFCHLGALLGFLIPLANIIVPLVIWLLKKDQSPFVDQNGKAALNFQISMIIWAVVGFILMFIVIGFLILWALLPLEIICIIIASVKAYQGENFKYPLTIQFIK